MPIAIFQNRPRLKALAINVTVVFVSAIVIVGIVLGAVLPNRGTKQSAASSTDVDSSESSFEIPSTNTFTTDLSSETTDSSNSKSEESQIDGISSMTVQSYTSLNTIATTSPLPSATENDVYLEGVAASIAATAAMPDFPDNMSSKKTWTVVVTVTHTKSKSQSTVATSSAVAASNPVATAATYVSTVS
ncbi:hypothetical protein GGI05_003212, partial [Coemansia sp. RSA 2603]